MKALKRKLAFPAAIAALSMCIPSTLHGAGKVEIPFNPGNFPAVPIINNQYFPHPVGTTFIYRAEAADECEESHIDVTDQIKTILGVNARVVHETAYLDEECDGVVSDDDIVETTDDWYAQDNGGNIWYLGEHSKDCDPYPTCTVSDGSWEAGDDGAVAGIIMLAHPKVGDQYYQEFYADHAEDQAKILRTDTWVSLYRDDAYGDSDYHGCIKTKEWTKLEPGEVEHKFYCPNVGLVAVDELKGKTLRFELVDVDPPL